MIEVFVASALDLEDKVLVGLFCVTELKVGRVFLGWFPFDPENAMLGFTRGKDDATYICSFCPLMYGASRAVNKSPSLPCLSKGCCSITFQRWYDSCSSFNSTVKGMLAA